MGVSETAAVASLKDMVQGRDELIMGNSVSAGSLLEVKRRSLCQAARKQKGAGRRHGSKMRRKRNIILIKKRRASRRRSGGYGIGIERRVRTLKNLIPHAHGVSTSMGLDGLFRETADYILCLQMRVKAMQIMVKVLTATY